MGLKQQIKKLLVLFLKNKKLMINGDYADNEIIVASIDGVEDKIIERVIELNKEENELENRGNFILDGKWIFSINGNEDCENEVILKDMLHRTLNVLNVFHKEYVNLVNLEEAEIQAKLLEFESEELKENINVLNSYFCKSDDLGINLNDDIDLLEIKKHFVEKSLEIERITDDLQKIISEKEGIRLELIKTLDKTSSLPDDEIFNKYGSAREYIVNERKTTKFRENLEFMAKRYSLNEKSEEEFIEAVEEKVYFIDEIREVTRKFDGKKGDYKEIAKEENNLTKIQCDKLELIISKFNDGKNSVEKALVGRKHKLFVMIDKLDFIIKKGTKLLNGVNSVSNCSVE